MGFFRRKGDNVLDLSEKYKKQQEKIAQMQSENQGSQTSSNAMGFLGDLAGAANASQDSESYVDVSESMGERKRKLSKRLLDMTNKIEDLSNQIYHLQQRVEVLERKLDVNRF